MAVVPLLGGAYVARSVVANAQRCVNLYPEKNQEDSEVPVTHYCTPGLLKLADGPTPTVWRGLYFANNEKLYGVLGDTVYRINDDWTLTSLGVIASAGRTPVSMIDNGSIMVIVDGTASGWTVDLSTDVLANITDPNFLGADFVQYIDTFFVFNEPGTRNFYSSLSNSIAFDPLDIAGKTGSADALMGLRVNHLDVWLLGRKTTEIWQVAPTQGFPFQRVPGVFIEHGCVAKHSIASYDINIFWLSQDNNGQALVLHGMNYQATTITTPAIADEIGKYEEISDAIGFVYQQGAHVFYVLIFPSANKTWVYDLASKEWHERVYTDFNGGENRIRANCTAFAFSKNVVGDFQNGKLYALDLDTYTDDGVPIMRRRGFPHLTGQGKTLYHEQFIANIETGTITSDQGNPTPAPWNADPQAPAFMPMVTLRWSDTRGHSWGEPVEMPLGAAGEYDTYPSWRDLGQARDRVYELYWSAPCAAALNGAYLDAQVLPI